MFHASGEIEYALLQLDKGKFLTHMSLSHLQIKLSSVQLARKYMKRVSTELDAMNEPEKEPNKEFMLLQGVRFAFRVHQVTFAVALFNRLRCKMDFWALFQFNYFVAGAFNKNYDQNLLQFAGGFDAESMRAFEELRSRARTQSTEENKTEDA